MSKNQYSDLFFGEKEYNEIAERSYRYYSSQKNKEQFKKFLRGKIRKCLPAHIEKSRRGNTVDKVLRRILNLAKDIPIDKTNELPYIGKAAIVARVIEMLYDESAAQGYHYSYKRGGTTDSDQKHLKGQIKHLTSLLNCAKVNSTRFHQQWDKPQTLSMLSGRSIALFSLRERIDNVLLGSLKQDLIITKDIIDERGGWLLTTKEICFALVKTYRKNEKSPNQAYNKIADILIAAEMFPTEPVGKETYDSDESAKDAKIKKIARRLEKAVSEIKEVSIMRGRSHRLIPLLVRTKADDKLFMDIVNNQKSFL